jgi:hypothetical protein
MKKRKFADGGYQDMSDMSPADVAEMRAREKATKAFNRAMPDPYEEGIYSKEKRRAALDSAMRKPMEMADEASSKIKKFADSEDGKKLMRAARFAAETSPAVASSKPALAIAEYGIDKLKEEGANRRRDMGENTNPMGDTFKRGGKVSSASKRADGCATKGKTKGTMIKMNYGGKC